MNNSKSSTESWIYQRLIRKSVRLSVVFFTVASIIFLISFLTAAAFECFKAIHLYWFSSSSDSNSLYESAGIEAIAFSLKAVEYILVAPLPYLFLLAIGNYVLKVGDLSQDSDTKDDLEAAQNLVVGVKTFATALLASIVAVDLTGSVLKSGELSLDVVLPYAIILAVLSLYLYILQMHSR